LVFCLLAQTSVQKNQLADSKNWPGWFIKKQACFAGVCIFATFSRLQLHFPLFLLPCYVSVVFDLCEVIWPPVGLCDFLLGFESSWGCWDIGQTLGGEFLIGSHSPPPYDCLLGPSLAHGDGDS